MSGLIGRKVGMTQVHDEAGKVVPVTVIQAGPCPVVQVKKNETDGYGAVQLGYEPLPDRKVKSPIKGHFARAGVAPTRTLHEFRTAEPEAYRVGQELKVGLFSAGDVVKVTGTTKGRGFAGGVKRHGFSGGDETHGTDTKRGPGSIGQSAWPARVWPGKRLPGQYGNKQQTVRNLRVVAVDEETDVLLIRGAVPGHTGALVLVTLSTGEVAPPPMEEPVVEAAEDAAVPAEAAETTADATVSAESEGEEPEAKKEDAS